MNNNTNNSQGGVVLGNITNSTLNSQPEPMPNNFTNNVTPTNPVMTPNTVVDNPSYIGQQNVSTVQNVQSVTPQLEQPVENLTFNSSIPDTLPNTNVVQEPVVNNNVNANPVDIGVGYTTNVGQINNESYAANSVNMNDSFNTNQTVNSVNMNQGFDVNANYNTNNTMGNVPPVTPINNMMGSEPISGQPDSGMKKKKGHGFLIFVLIILVLGLCAGAAWYFFLKDKFVKQTPKEVYVKVLNSMNTDVSLLDDFKTSSGNISLSVSPKNSAFKKFDLNIISTIDRDANYLQYGIDARYNGESALAGDVFYTNNKLYLKADSLYSNLLEIDSSDFVLDFDDFGASTNNGNTKVIIDSIISAIKDSFKDEYFTQTVEDNVTINKFTLTNDSYVTFMTDFLNNLKANNAYVKEIANINDSSEEEVRNNLDNEISNLEGKNIEISVYTGSSKSVSKIVMDLKDDNAIITVDNIIDNGFNYSISVGGTAISGKVAINLNGQTQTVKITIDSNDLTVTLDASFESNVTVTKAEINEEKVTKVSELTDYDKGMIQINLMSNEALLNLINDLGSVSKLLPISDDLSIM